MLALAVAFVALVLSLTYRLPFLQRVPGGVTTVPGRSQLRFNVLASVILSIGLTLALNAVLGLFGR